MIPNGNANGFMFINANHMGMGELRKDWNHHLSLTDEIVISIKGEPKIEGNRMTGEFEVTGAREPFVGHAVAIDGGHGWTLTLVLLSPVSQYDIYKNNFAQLVASSVVRSLVLEHFMETLIGRNF